MKDIRELKEMSPHLKRLINSFFPTDDFAFREKKW